MHFLTYEKLLLMFYLIVFMQAGWLILDATKVAEHWTFFPHSNMGLYLKVTDDNGREHDPSDMGKHNSLFLTPSLT